MLYGEHNVERINKNATQLACLTILILYTNKNKCAEKLSVCL